jgi:two-component system LytT family sensor kinase
MTSLMMMGFLSNTTIVGILLAVKQAFDRVKSISAQRKQEKERLESELQYLKAQVNPHFLFNSINSVYILIRKDPEQAAETLLKLSDLLRFSLYDCSEEFIPIEKELDYISNFIELEKLRKGKRVTVDFQADKHLGGFMIAPFLLIPFLENAFKFVSNNGSGNEIKIKIAHCNDKLEATFFNTCDNHLVVSDVGGIGIPNVKRRLELMYPGKHTLIIQPTDTSYSVTLSVDVA